MALLKPSKKPRWATALSALVSEPSESKKTQGWIKEKPPLNWFNWIQKTTYDWIDYLDKSSSKNSYAVLDRENIIMLDGGYWNFDLSSDEVTWSDTIRLMLPGTHVNFENQLATDTVSISNGQAAVVSLNMPVRFKGNITNASTEITNVEGIELLEVGMIIGGASTASPGATITAIDEANATVSISGSAGATTSGADLWGYLDDTPTVNVVAINTYVPKDNEFIFIRRENDVCYIGIGPSTTKLQDTEKKKLYGPGFIVVTKLLAGENLAAGDVVYVSTGASDGSRTQNSAYKTSCYNTTNPTVRSQAFGIVRVGANAGSYVEIVTFGVVPAPSAGTFRGRSFYVGGTAGTLQDSAPTAELNWVCRVAHDVFDPESSTAQMLINPSPTRQIALDQYQIENIGILATVGGNNLTINITNRDGTDPTPSNPIYINFRYPNPGNAFTITRKITSALSLFVPTGNGLGHIDNVKEPIFVYAVDNSGTVEIAVSTRLVDTDYPITTATMATSNNRTTVYQTTGRSNKPITLIGVMYSTQPTTGLYTVTPTDIRLGDQAMIPLTKIQSDIGPLGNITGNVDINSMNVGSIASSGNVVVSGDIVPMGRVGRYVEANATTYDLNVGFSASNNSQSATFLITLQMHGDATNASNTVYIVTLYGTTGITATSIHSSQRGSSPSLSAARQGNNIRFVTNAHGAIKRIAWFRISRGLA